MTSSPFADLTMTLAPVRRADPGETAPEVAWDRMGCVALYGVMLTGRRLLTDLSGGPVADLTVDEALEASGEWMAVFRSEDDPDTHLVLTDPFAFQTVFHSQVDVDGRPHLVLGTTARGVAFERRSLGQAFEPDWPHIAATLATNDWLAATMLSDRTADAATRTMRPFQMMVVTGGRAHIVERADLTRLRGLDYCTLLDHGITTACAQIRALADADVPARRINLSGGKDSRLMLALVKGADALDAFDVRSVNPRTWGVPSARAGLEQDLLLADTLRRRYGMTWSRETGYTTQTCTPFEPLETWQDLCGEINHGFRFHRRRRTRTELVVELRGASGETFRGTNYWQRHARLAEVADTPESFDADARVVFDRIHRPDLVSAGLVPQMFEHFLESLRGTGRASLIEAGNRHYTLYRNRAHFGTTLRFAQDGAVPFFPLSQVAFVLAGEQLDHATLRSGAVFFDVIERLAPELNDLRFDKGPWPEPVASRRGDRDLHAWTETTSVDEMDEYLRNEELSAAAARTADDAEDGGHTILTQAKPYVLAQTRAVIDELRGLPGAGEVLTGGMVSWLLTLPETQLVWAQTQLAKLVSVRDAVVGREASVRLRPSGREGFEGLRALTRRAAPVPAGFRRDLSVLLFRVAVRRDGDEVLARIHVDHGEGDDLEFAFYLRDDGGVLDRRGYSTERTASFTRPAEAGHELQVQAFVRYARRPGQVFILRSDRFA